MKLSNIIKSCFIIITALLLASCANGDDPECGRHADGALCPKGMCCSKEGYCGTADAYCGPGHCQSQCPTAPSPAPPPPSPDVNVSNIITKELFEEMLPRFNDTRCPAHGFYTYDAFIAAATAFPDFGTTGTLENRTRELAAFFAQTSHQTRGEWPIICEPYDWGYCFVRQINQSDSYCDKRKPEWNCFEGQKYYGRGPIQITYNYNYGPAGQDIGVNLLLNADLVATDPIISFKTAIWFWMTPQYPKPSSHDVIIGAWTPNEEDVKANRVPGYGMITNNINGTFECGPENAENHDNVLNRIGFFQRYCDILNIDPGDNLDCADQTPIIENNNADVLIRMPVDQA